MSPTLGRLLERHAATRGGTGSDDAVFRIANDQAMTRRRYSTIFDQARDVFQRLDDTGALVLTLRS